MQFGGFDSNSRLADYEKSGPALQTRCLHGYHGAVPPMALMALFARVTRSMNRSTLDLDYPLFFVDRVEDAVPPGPQAPRIR
jgi:hypothetical protein